MKKFRDFLVISCLLIGGGLIAQPEGYENITIPTPDLAIKFSSEKQNGNTYTPVYNSGIFGPGLLTTTDVKVPNPNQIYDIDRLKTDEGATLGSGNDRTLYIFNNLFGKTSSAGTPVTISFWVKVVPEVTQEDGEGFSDNFFLALDHNKSFIPERKGLTFDGQLLANRRIFDERVGRDLFKKFFFDYSFFAPASLDAGEGWYHIIWVIGDYHQRIYVGKPNDVIYERSNFGKFGSSYAWLGLLRNQSLSSVNTSLVLSDASAGIIAFDNLCVWDDELSPKQVRALHECQRYNKIDNCFDVQQLIPTDEQPEVISAFTNKIGDYIMVASYREAYQFFPNRRQEVTYSPASFRSYLSPLYNLGSVGDVDAVEVDIRFSSDGVPFIFPDHCVNLLVEGKKGAFSNYSGSQISQMELVKISDPGFYDTEEVRIQSLSNLNSRIKTMAAGNNLKAFEKLLVFNIYAPTDDKYAEAFKQLILLANKGNWLDRLAIKGKLSKKDLIKLIKENNAEQNIAVGLDDFNYIPVVDDSGPGQDRAAQDNFKSDFINNNDSLGLQFAQLEYQWSNGNLLKINKFIGQDAPKSEIFSTVGQSTMSGMHPAVTYLWRDASQGVLQNSGTHCPPGYKEYSISDKSYNYSTSIPATDGRIDLDFIVSNGARYIKTDHSENVISYLKGKGLREKDDQEGSSVVTEETVPANFTYGTVQVSGIKGMARKISDISKVEFATVDRERQSIPSQTLIDWWQRQPEPDSDPNPWNTSWVAPMDGCQSCFCSAQYMPKGQRKTGFTINYALPLRTLPQWALAYYKGGQTTYDIFINANRFDSRDPMESSSQRNALQKIYYGMSCSAILGPFYARKNNDMGEDLTQFRPHHYDWDPPSAQDDGFVVLSEGGVESIVMTKYADTDDFVSQNKDKVKLVLGGHIIAKDGKIPTTMPQGSGSGTPKKRVLVGVTANNEVFVVATFSEHKSVDVAKLMVFYYGCMDVFQFDSGGSVAMLASDGTYPKPVPKLNLKGGAYDNEVLQVDNIKVASPPLDRPPGVTKAENSDNPANWAYRPIPNFLGIRVKDAYRD